MRDFTLSFNSHTYAFNICDEVNLLQVASFWNTIQIIFIFTNIRN